MTNEVREFADDPLDAPAVSGYLHTPTLPCGDALVLSHGAGANANAPLLIALADAFCAAGLAVLRCDLPFRQLRPQGPPPRGSAERDQQGLKAAIAAMRRANSGRIFLGGHSYGGRQSSMLAAAQPGLVERLLLLSYPLHPPRRPEELRTTHFPHLSTPVLFVHGARDPFGSIEELTTALQLIPGPTQLLTVPSAGHELLSAKNRETLPKLVVDRFLALA